MSKPTPSRYFHLCIKQIDLSVICGGKHSYHRASIPKFLSEVLICASKYSQNLRQGSHFCNRFFFPDFFRNFDYFPDHFEQKLKVFFHISTLLKKNNFFKSLLFFFFYFHCLHQTQKYSMKRTCNFSFEYFNPNNFDFLSPNLHFFLHCLWMIFFFFFHIFPAFFFFFFWKQPKFPFAPPPDWKSSSHFSLFSWPGGNPAEDQIHEIGKSALTEISGRQKLGMNPPPPPVVRETEANTNTTCAKPLRSGCPLRDVTDLVHGTCVTDDWGVFAFFRAVSDSLGNFSVCRGHPHCARTLRNVGLFFESNLLPCRDVSSSLQNSTKMKMDSSTQTSTENCFSKRGAQTISLFMTCVCSWEQLEQRSSRKKGCA